MNKKTNSNSPTFILASSSPRRKELLQYLGFPFSVRPSSVSEEIKDPSSPPNVVQTLAHRKAADVAQNLSESIILGADTVVVYRRHIIGKPKTIEHARSMIQSLKNSIHQVITGTSLIQTDAKGKIVREETFHESTQVTFGDIQDELIENYVANGNPLDKAGGYGIQDKWGAIFTKCIEGDFYNVMGLPVHRLYKELKSFSPELL